MLKGPGSGLMEVLGSSHTGDQAGLNLMNVKTVFNITAVFTIPGTLFSNMFGGILNAKNDPGFCAAKSSVPVGRNKTAIIIEKYFLFFFKALKVICQNHPRLQ